ncbi:uncharacterized protein LOC123526843 [Mercenaria mercenaria]|uniref:uncharacterized protein LOC123526843 n=1 Tax=Mercenaria mercenaria TaxID=6596 RepID=UPI00234E8D28|nr:uncharacterized protein LOC123526843 [Mercenaria mercenaria]
MTRSYHPITLESVIGKIMERIVKNRLTWRIEVEGGIAATQYAYRKNKSCTQTVLRIVNLVEEAHNNDEKITLVLMDYESCFERIWRAGLMKKATNSGVKGRMWMYLKNFLTDRNYYIKVNDYSSEELTSKVGIPLGSVLSPTLCNIYTSDSLDNVGGKHAEYADDVSLLNQAPDLKEVVLKTNEDLDRITNWCNKWNMKVAPEKTSAMIFCKNRDDIQSICEDISIELDNKRVEIVRSKKILGITLDDKLSFQEHIAVKTKSGYEALRNIDVFINQNAGCTQSNYMRLYKSLVLPVIDYGAPIFITSNDSYYRQFNGVQRSAMLKATGCVSTTSTDTLEILTNCTPMELHMKLRQCQELVRIAEKRETDPLKKEFNTWMSECQNSKGRPKTFQLMISRFNEVREDIKLENIEQEFQYSKEHLGLSRTKEYVHTETFHTSKDMQVSNIKDILGTCKDNCILAFTDGSAIGNPGPTGAGAAVYLNGYDSIPVLLKRSVSKRGNNFSGEIVGIEIALEFLTEVTSPTAKKIHIFTDCQAAITSVFCKEVPTKMIENIITIKKYLANLQDRKYEIEIHWIPGHKELTGNELADSQAKAAASEMCTSDTEENTEKRDAREVVKIMKENIKEKWNNKYSLSENVENIQEVYQQAGVRSWWERKTGKLFV